MKLKEEIKKEIKAAFSAFVGINVPEDALVSILADNAIAFLELDPKILEQWYEKEDNE